MHYAKDSVSLNIVLIGHYITNLNCNASMNTKDGASTWFTALALDSVKLTMFIITPHAQCERGKMIGRGVHIYICLWSKKKFESYFRDRLTFSNVDSRTSR